MFLLNNIWFARYKVDAFVNSKLLMLLVSDVFQGILGSKLKKDNCHLPKIHIYGFSKAENPEFDFHEVRI